VIDEELKAGLPRANVVLPQKSGRPETRLVVHGRAGRRIRGQMADEARAKKGQFVQGMRVTGPRGPMDIVEIGFSAGTVNKGGRRSSSNQGPAARAGRCLHPGQGRRLHPRRRKLLIPSKENGHVGYRQVGRVESIDPEVIGARSREGGAASSRGGAPSAPAPDGTTYNINATSSAGKLAEDYLKAEKSWLVAHPKNTPGGARHERQAVDGG